MQLSDVGDLLDQDGHSLFNGSATHCSAKGWSGMRCDWPSVKFCPAPRFEWRGGAKTPEGIQRIREANGKHGERTVQAEREASRLAGHIRRCEDALRVLGAIGGNQRVGRWPSAYKPIKTQADVEAFVEGFPAVFPDNACAVKRRCESTCGAK